MRPLRPGVLFADPSDPSAEPPGKRHGRFAEAANRCATAVALSARRRTLSTRSPDTRRTATYRAPYVMAAIATTNATVTTTPPPTMAHTAGRAQFIVQPTPKRSGRNRLASSGLK